MKKFLLVFAVFLLYSGIRAQVDENTYYSRIYHTCKVWGYVKYFHTGVASGMVDWDSVLVSSVEDIKNATDNEEFNRVLLEMISQAGEMQSSSEELPEVPDSLNNTPDHNWMEADIFTEDVKAKLLDIRDKFRPQTNVYIPTHPYFYQPDFSQDDAYAYGNFYPSEGERVLAIYRYWNIINYFFPYKIIMDRDWDDVLMEFIPKIVNSNNSLEYTLAFKEFTTHINDSHAYFYSATYNLWTGQFFPPFSVRFIENEMVITEVKPTEERIFRGDVIKRIDGYDIYELRDSLRKYAHGSNDVIIDRELNEIILKGNVGSFEITIERGSELITDRLYRSSMNPDNNTNLPIWNDTIVNGCSFGIVDMGKLQIEDLDNMFDDLWESDYIIFDIRNYPNDVLWDMIGYLFKEPIHIANFNSPSTTHPGTFAWEYEIIGGYNSNVYQNNIILLFDERTQSHAEYTCMGLEQFPGAIKIGSTTSAADGNTEAIFLPGKIATIATFLGTYYSDFTPTQRVGIIPDFEVHPTIQGIREGRDEVLEFALNRCSLNDIDMYEQYLKQVKLYPNPATDNLNFEFDESLTGIIEIYDISGRKCKSISYASNSGSVDISDLNQGAYIINIISGGKNIKTEKFMKK